MATLQNSRILAWNPMDKRAWWDTVHGVTDFHEEEKREEGDRRRRPGGEEGESKGEREI